MGSRLLIRGARQLLTLRGPSAPRRGAEMSRLGVLNDGAMLVENGVISHIGSASQVENRAEARGAAELNVEGRVVMPGLIDCHTHLLSSLPQWPVPAPPSGATPLCCYSTGGPATARAIQASAAKYLQFMANHGTTLAEVTTSITPDDLSGMRALQALQGLKDPPIPTIGSLMALPEQQDRLAEDGWSLPALVEVLERSAKRGWCQFADLMFRPTLGLNEAMSLMEAAVDLGLNLKIHDSPFTPLGALDLLLELTALKFIMTGPPAPEAWTALRQGGMVAVLMPSLYQRSGYAAGPLGRHLIDAGCAVALASGFNPAVNPVFSMQTVLRLACGMLGMTAEEAIVASTANAASALSVAGQTGTLEYGKQADFLVLSISDYRELPHYAGANLVSLAMHKGRPVSRIHELQCPDVY